MSDVFRTPPDDLERADLAALGFADSPGRVLPHAPGFDPDALGSLGCLFSGHPSRPPTPDPHSGGEPH